jgi:DNA-binding beta-propeller fold protein YncE
MVVLLADIAGGLSAVLIGRGFWELYHRPRQLSPSFMAGAAAAVTALVARADAAILLVMFVATGVSLAAYGIASRRRSRAQRVPAAATDPSRLASITGVGRNPQSIVVSEDGATGFVAAAGGTLAVVDLATGQVRTVIQVGKGAQNALPLPDGNRVLVSVARRRGYVAVVDLALGRVSGELPGITDPRGMALSADGRVYVTSFSDNTVYRLDAQSLHITGRADVAKPVDVEPNFDGSVVVVAAMWNQAVVFVDAEQMKPLTAVKIPSSMPRRLVLDASEDLLFVACLDGTLAVVDMIRQSLIGLSRPATDQGGVAALPAYPSMCCLVDSQMEALLLISHPGGRIHQRVRFGGRAPLDVATSGDRIYVACLSGSVDVLQLSALDF